MSKGMESHGNGNLKRKFEEPQPIAVKRKRGRPPLDRSISTPQSPPPVTSSATPNLIVSRPAPQGTNIPIIHTPERSQMALLGPQPVAARNILPEIKMERKKSFQVSWGGISYLVHIDNHFKEVNGGTMARSLHRIMVYSNGGVRWTSYTTALISSVVSASNFIAATCTDSTLHLLDIQNGGLILPPIQLHGKTAKLVAVDSYLLILSTVGFITLWDVVNRKKILSECVRHLLEGRVDKEGIQGVHLVATYNESQNCESDVNKEEYSSCSNCNAGQNSSDKVKQTNVEKDSSTKEVLTNGNEESAKQDKGDKNINPTLEAVEKAPESEEMEVENPPPSKMDKLNEILNGNRDVTTSKATNSSASQKKKKSLVYLPVIVLLSGDVFTRCQQLQTWLQLGKVLKFLPLIQCVSTT